MTFRISVFSIFLISSLTAFLLLSGCRKGSSPVTIKETITDNGGGTGTTTWKNDKTYILDGRVFVNAGQTLTIEPGTVIQGRTGQGEDASALIVARGGKILAAGTAEKPIIFTVEGDDLKGSVPVHARGLWGGLIILGRALLNTETGEAHIEGIPVMEDRGVYGGQLEEDNSGKLQYISIRHGGTNIGEGNEINGLTLGGVGSSTVIDHIEVISNQDDGLECFGGSVNLKNIVVSYCGDDALDVDLGYNGNIQFFLAIQAPETGDKLIEATGGMGHGYGLPYTLPAISNFTGIGHDAFNNGKLATFSSNSAGKVINSIFTGQNQGIFIEYTIFEHDSYQHFSQNNLLFESNVFWNIAGNDSSLILRIMAEPGMDISAQENYLKEYFHIKNNAIKNYGIGFQNGRFFIRPDKTDFPNLATYPNDWFTRVSYKGAFLDDNWIMGWTLISEEGVIEF